MNIAKVISVLKQSGMIVGPSDTVYGLLCDATNERAVEKLIEFKERPKGKAISVFVADLKMLKEYVEVDDDQLKILKQLFPGPYTAVLKSKHKVISLLESEEGTLGVRIPKYDFIKRLVKKFGKPVTATSANLAGRSPCYSVESLYKQISKKKKDLIDLVIDVGKLPRNKPSTVLDLTKPEIKVIREGDMRFTSTRIYKSGSEKETKVIAKNFFKELDVKGKVLGEKPIIFIIKGELGAGKTIFVKGIGEYLGIKNIISPTFVIYYEYDITTTLRSVVVKKLIHIDLYNLEKEEEFEHLGLEKYLKPGNILCIEWGERTASILNKLKEKAMIVYVHIKYIDENKREIAVNS